MNLANRITITRIVLSPLMIACLLYYSPERSYFHVLAVLCFAAACFSDALDGYVARRLNEKTELGTYIDPIADKLLIWSATLSLSLMPHLPTNMRMPAWVTIPVISRDVVIFLGSMVIFFTSGKLKPEPIFIGKITTVSQMLSLMSVMCRVPDPIQIAANIAAVFFTVWSGVLYVQMGGRMLQSS